MCGAVMRRRGDAFPAGRGNMCVKAVRALAQAAERCGPTQMSTAQVNERIRALRQLACAKRQLSAVSKRYYTVGTYR